VVLAVKEYYPSGLVNRIPGDKNVILFTGNRAKEYNHGLLRFLDEAKSMARFSSHASIINVFEYFEENNTAYIVMEYLDGITLNDFLKSNRLDLDACVQIVQSVCTALKEIHAAGIVHRDVSPDNIFLCTNDAIKLIDFGAARFSAGEEKQMTIILKPGFAPPEQYNRVDVQGPWTDIYALGATLYLMITGVKPEESTNRKIEDTLAAPQEIDAEIPAYVSNTVMKAMAIDKHMRFASIAEFERALNQEKKVLPVEKEKKRRQRRRLAGVAAALLVVVAGASFFWLNWSAEKEAETLPDATIALWYPLSGDEEADEAKQEAFQSVIEAFHDSFPNVTVQIKTVEAEDYAEAIEEAIEEAGEAGGAGAAETEAPVLFESGGLDEDLLADTLDLSGVIASIDEAPCYFLDQYAAYFPEKNQIPLGFRAPVIYVNTSIAQFDADRIEEAGDLAALTTEAAHPAVIDAGLAPAFDRMFGSGLARYGAAEAKAAELFLQDEAALYFADSAAFFRIRDAMPARYKLVYADSQDIPAAFDELWSVNPCSAAERKAAERLLTFLLSDNAQDYLHVQNVSRALPLNKHVLTVFCDVYQEFDGFFDNIDRYTMTPAEE
jgi:ABC-type glycerol-3-phosphate transport system substrate-binding protein